MHTSAPLPVEPDSNAEVAACIHAHLPLWRQLSGRRILLTGATGFFGNWILRFFAEANRLPGLEIRVIATSRNATRFLAANPHFATAPWLSFVEGDTASQSWGDRGITDLIHAASPIHGEGLPEDLLFDMVQGTRSVLTKSQEARVPRILYISSGSVYGQAGLPPDTVIREDWTCAPDLRSPSTSYAEGKRVCEWLCQMHAQRTGAELRIARCFSFCGPGLALDSKFAAINFLTDVARGLPIRIKGDGKAVRSYMYPTDLVTWLVKILVDGRQGQAYNVGSDVPVSMADLARLIARIGGRPDTVEILGAKGAGLGGGYYVPSIELARVELGCELALSLEQSMVRTFNWVNRQLK